MTENDPVAFAEFTSTNCWEDFPRDDFSVIANSKAFEVQNSDEITDNLSGHIVKLKTNTETIFAIEDSGSPMSILNFKQHSNCRK